MRRTMTVMRRTDYLDSALVYDLAAAKATITDEQLDTLTVLTNIHRGTYVRLSKALSIRSARRNIHLRMPDHTFVVITDTGLVRLTDATDGGHEFGLAGVVDEQGEMQTQDGDALTRIGNAFYLRETEKPREASHEEPAYEEYNPQAAHLLEHGDAHALVIGDVVWVRLDELLPNLKNIVCETQEEMA